MDAAGASPLSSEPVAERLRARGHRVTRQRLGVFEALARLGGHRGVDEIAAWLRQSGEPLPETSVYNAVEVLEASDLVRVAHRGPPRSLYEVADRAHDHFVCRACGEIVDVELPRRRPPLPPVPGAVVESVEITYRGVCAGCGGA